MLNLNFENNKSFKLIHSNNDGTLTSIINSSKSSPPWENGDKLLENQKENKLLYSDCTLVIQG